MHKTNINNPQNDPNNQAQTLLSAQEEAQFLADPTLIPQHSSKKPKKHFSPQALFNTSHWLKGLTAALFLATLVSGSLAFHYFNQNQKLLSRLSQKPTGQVLGVNNETQKLLEEVGQYITLPKDEAPTIATVSDPSKLKDQPFFAKSEIGDKVLIFASSNRAILYRPKQHKIIEISSLDTPSPTPTPSSTTPPENSSQTSQTPPTPTPSSTTPR